jgi:hypothetical protein
VYGEHMICSIFDPEDGNTVLCKKYKGKAWRRRQHIPWKCWYPTTGLKHSVTSQTTTICMTILDKCSTTKALNSRV